MRRLVTDLKSEGLIAWTGDYLKMSGDYWLTSLHQALDQANCLLVLLTPDAGNAFPVKQAVEYAHQHNIPVVLVIAKGDPQTIRLWEFGDAALIDIRQRVQTNDHLLSPELHNAIIEPRPQRPKPYLYWNPVDQCRLFFAMFWHPNRIRHDRHDRQLTNLKRTGGWLAVSMFIMILLASAIGDVIADPNLRSFSRIVLITIPSIWSGQFFEAVTGWNFILNAIIAGLAMILLLLASLLLIDLHHVKSVGLTGTVFFITFPFLSGIAGGIAEAFQTHRLMIFFFTLTTAFVWGAVAISLMATTVVSSLGTGAGGILTLLLMGSAVGIFAILVVYLLLFLVADSLIRTLFLNKRSHVSRAVPAIGIACYALLFMAAIF
jgi:hypothetical protein